MRARAVARKPRRLERNGTASSKNSATTWGRNFECSLSTLVMCQLRLALHVCRSKEKVNSNLRKLTMLLKNLVHLTDREMPLLAVAVTEMQMAGHDPYSEEFVIQVVPRLDNFSS